MHTNDLLHHVKFNRWATERLFQAAQALPVEQFSRDLGVSYQSVRGTLRHIYQADRIWFQRLIGQPTGSLDQYETPEELEAWKQDWETVHERYLSWAESLGDADWDQVIPYRDVRGNPYQTPARQIILHLINHNSYHPGQVAGLLRQLEQAPPTTDLIAYYRSL